MNQQDIRCGTCAKCRVSYERNELRCEVGNAVTRPEWGTRCADWEKYRGANPAPEPIATQLQALASRVAELEAARMTAEEQAKALREQLGTMTTKFLSVEGQLQRTEAELRDARGLLDKERERHQWRPIETAPKDGTYVLSWDPVEIGFLEVIQWKPWGWETASFDSIAPTHWMPLPEPPKDKA